MNGLIQWLDSQRANGLLLMRIGVGVVLILAGEHKLFGEGIPAMIDKWNQAGLIGAQVLGVLVPILEFFGGIAILLGIATRLLSIWMIVQFALIVVYVKPAVFAVPFSQTFVDIAMVGCALILATHGPGPLALGAKVIGKSWAR
jgi:putative oxidoreductase